MNVLTGSRIRAVRAARGWDSALDDLHGRLPRRPAPGFATRLRIGLRASFARLRGRLHDRHMR